MLVSYCVFNRKIGKRIQKIWLFPNVFTQHNIEKVTNLYFASKQKDLKEFETNLELVQDETEGIRSTNED